MGKGRRVAGLLVGVAMIVGGVRLAESEDPGNSACSQFCNQVFPPGDERGNCKSEAAQGEGLCFECGPSATDGQQLCGQVCCAVNESCCGDACANLAIDRNNCGACGNVCPDSFVCQGGACDTCPFGTANCGGSCINILTDPDNCGGCDRVCQPHPDGSRACVRGTCV